MENSSPYKNFYNPEDKEPEFKPIAKAIAWAILVIIIALLFSCNPTQKVLTNPKRFNEVGLKWAALNPCVNDTILQYIPGDSVITLRTDTLRYAWVFNDTVVREKIITKTKTITIKDTIVNVVKDIRDANRVMALQGDLMASNTKIEQLQVEVKKREKWVLGCAMALFVLGICIGLLMKYKL